MNKDEGSIKLKENDNLVISDDNYGVMLDIKDLNVSEKETSKENPLLTEEPKDVDVLPLDNAEKQEVSFSNDLDVNEIEPNLYGDEKLKIEDVNLDLGDVISIDSVDTPNNEPSLLGDIETLV